MATLKDLLVSGPARVIGKITATSFVKNGATANNILLAGGGDVAQSAFASSGHEHSVSLVSGGTSTVNLAANTAYTLTVGGSSIVFKTPSDNNNNTVTTGKSGVVLGTTGVAVVQKDGTDSGTVALPSAPPSTWLGTSSSTAAAGNHTHTTTIATSTGTSQITLAYETKYSITAGGTSYIFTTPSLGTSATTAAAGNHTHTTSLTSGGTSTISLAANTAYTLTAGGTSVVFKTPADNNNVTTGKSNVVLGTTGVAVVQKDGTDSGTVALPSTIPSTWLGTSATTAAAGNHTHSGYLTSHQTIKVDGVTGATTSHYGTCSTGATTAAKAVTVTGTPTLEAGLRVIVKFTTTNTAASPTLNVNSLGAKSIYYRGSAITGSSNNILQANRVYEFVYDGTYWQLVGDIDTNTNNVTTGKSNVVLGTTGVAVVQKDGTDSGTVALPSAPPSSWLGTTATTAATGSHEHNLSIVAGGTSTVNLSADTAYTLTAGGKTLVFKTPADANTNTDTKVTQTVTTSTNTSPRPLLLGYSYSDAATFSPTTVTNTSLATHLAKLAPSTGILSIVGLNKMTTSGTMVTGSSNTLWNTNGGTTNLSIVYGNNTSTSNTANITNSNLYINLVNSTASTVISGINISGTGGITVTTPDDAAEIKIDGSGVLPSTIPSDWLGTTSTTAAAGNHTHSGYLTSHQTIKVDGVTGATTSHYGTCGTAAGTTAKAVTVTGTPTLEAGLRVIVKFTTTNTATNPTLNVNSLGAKSIYYRGSAITSSNNNILQANRVYEFVYDGTYWQLVGDINTNSGGTVTSVGLTNATNGGLTVSDSPVTGSGSITVGHTNVLSSAQTTQAVYPIAIDKNGHISSYGTAVTIPTNTDNYGTINIETAAGTAAKTATVPWSYTLKQGNMFIVYLKNSNTNTAATLSINSTTAKSVLLDDEALTSSSWAAGTYLCYYDGTYYRMYTKNPEWVVKQTAVSSTSAEYPMLFSSTQDPTSGALYGTSYTTKTKVSNNGDIILHNSATSGTINSPSLIFRRGGATDSYVDFSIQNASGIFTVSQRSTSAFAARMQLTHTGDLTITGSDSTHGNMTANSYIKANPTNATGILLADGTDIAQSTFAQSTHSHYITDLADVYTDSQRINEVLAFNGSIWEGMYVAKTVNAGSGLNTTSGDTTNDGGYIGWGQSGGGDASVPTGTLHLTRVNESSDYNGTLKPVFGPATDTTVSSSNNTFTVPYYKVDKFGRVTESANKTITISGLGTGGGGGDTVTGKSNVTLGTTATAVLQVNGSDSGSVALPSAPPTTWLSTTATTAAAGNHSHGTITNGGLIRGNSSQAGGTGNNQVAIANGDRIVIADYSGRTSTNYYPLKMTSIVFDGSTTTQFLSKKGTWETPSGGGNISAISPESLVQGYKAGGVVIGQERTEFIVPPARIVESGAASEYNLQRQGVVRPQYEIDATLWDDTLALNSGTRFNNFDMVIVPTIPPESGINACCFLPITVMYRYNAVTNRYESVPGILISSDISKPFDMYDIQSQYMFRQK